MSLSDTFVISINMQMKRDPTHTVTQEISYIEIIARSNVKLPRVRQRQAWSERQGSEKQIINGHMSTISLTFTLTLQLFMKIHWNYEKACWTHTRAHSDTTLIFVHFVKSLTPTPEVNIKSCTLLKISQSVTYCTYITRIINKDHVIVLRKFTKNLKKYICELRSVSQCVQVCL